MVYQNSYEPLVQLCHSQDLKLVLLPGCGLHLHSEAAEAAGSTCFSQRRQVRRRLQVVRHPAGQVYDTALGHLPLVWL